MKLKTLLLGSAAAMIAVTGVRAADAVIVEPEPVEYVRVCDLYGSGFYYMPGTETCIDFGGYLRTTYFYTTDQFGTDNATGSASRWDYRARFEVDVRNETDYGTLRSQLRFQGDRSNGGDADVLVDRALISLGGLRIGYSDSYLTTLNTFAYGFSGQDNLDGYYGYDQAIFADYTFAVGGFSVTAGLQDAGQLSATPGNPHAGLDYYAGASYAGSLGNIEAAYIYEDNADNVPGRLNDGDSSAFKVSAAYTGFEGLTIKGWFTGDDGENSRTVEGTGDYNWGVAGAYSLMDNLQLAVGYTNGDNLNDYTTVRLNWEPVSGLRVSPFVRVWSDGDLGQDYALRVYRTF